MILPDPVIFGLTGVFALIFSIEAWDMPTHGIYSVESKVVADMKDVEDLLDIGRLFARIRIPAFFMIAGVLWIALGFMFGSANNCDFTYQACYTSPLYSATTATITIYTYGFALEALFILIGSFFIVMFSVYAISILRSFVKDRNVPKPYSGPT